jgi:predicted membrane protein
MQIQYTLVALATIAQFILGAVWYSPLMFGKWWMQIMEVTHIPKTELAKMQKEMMPFYGLQLVMTIIFTLVTALFLAYVKATSLTPICPYLVTTLVWFGFIVPTQVATVIWGKTKKTFWVKQIFVLTSSQFVGLMLATFILSF